MGICHQGIRQPQGSRSFPLSVRRPVPKGSLVEQRPIRKIMPAQQQQDNPCLAFSLSTFFLPHTDANVVSGSHAGEKPPVHYAEAFFKDIALEPPEEARDVQPGREEHPLLPAVPFRYGRRGP